MMIEHLIIGVLALFVLVEVRLLFIMRKSALAGAKDDRNKP